MATPIPFLLLAVKGKIDFVKITSPFGSGKPAPQDPSPQEVSDKIRAAMRAARKA